MSPKATANQKAPSEDGEVGKRVRSAHNAEGVNDTQCRAEKKQALFFGFFEKDCFLDVFGIQETECTDATHR